MRILAIGAHPDDVEFGCTPILMLETARGNSAKVLVATRGEAASNGTPAEREAEARAAARIAGAESGFLDLDGDCHLTYGPALSIVLAREFRSFKPDVVLAPLTDENQHPDHVAIGRAARDACRLARYGGLEDLTGLAPHRVGALYSYAITQSFTTQPTVLIDVSSIQKRWAEAVACHKSQMRTRSYDTLVFARARTSGAAMGVDFAVPLWANDPLTPAALSDLPFTARNY